MNKISGTPSFLDNLLEEEVKILRQKKKAFSIERISNGSKKNDPFEGKATNNVWKIKGNKLLKNKKFK